jgi:hypothetical protein
VNHVLLSQVIPSLQTLHTPLRINNALFSGEERVALATHLNPDLRFSRTQCEFIPTGAHYRCIVIVLGVNVRLHKKILPE